MNNLEDLFQNRKVTEFPKGKIIVYEGHSVNKLYHIVSGYIKVYTVVGANNQRVLFVYRAGDIFPLTTLLSGNRVARFFYETITTVALNYITPTQLENKLRNNLQLGEEIIGYTSSLDKQFVQRVNNMVSNKDALSKIKVLLFFICERAGSGNSLMTIDMPLSTKVIANMCGITTKEAAEQLDYLKSRNIVSSAGGLVVDQQKLRALKTP